MNELLFVLIGIIVLTNLVYTLWSFFSLKKMIGKVTPIATDDRFLLEHIVHSRSSLNLVYASIAIMAFVLGFFGFNIQKNITTEVKKEITEAARVDLDTLKSKSDNISLFESFARQSVSEINKFRDQARAIVDNIKRNPQKLFVIESLLISKQKNSYLFSELKPVDGTLLPQISQPPMILWLGYNPKSGEFYGTRVKATTKGIEVDAYDESYLIDLWIYVR